MSETAPDVLPLQSLCEIFERMLAAEVFGREHSCIYAGNFQTGVSQDENAVLWPSISFSIQGSLEGLPFEYSRMNILIAPQGNCKPAFECLRNPLAETMAGKIDRNWTPQTFDLNRGIKRIQSLIKIRPLCKFAFR